MVASPYTNNTNLFPVAAVLDTTTMTTIPEFSWQREVNGEDYAVSTQQARLDRAFVNDAFASQDMHWARRLPEDQVDVLLKHSLTLGLYKILPAVPPPASASEPSSPRTPSPTLENSSTCLQIGMARFNTDYVTFLYLTDVYIAPEHRSAGHGAWLIKCCKEIVNSMPHLRRVALMSSSDVGMSYYAKALGVWNVLEEADHMACMTKTGPGFGKGGE